MWPAPCPSRGWSAAHRSCSDGAFVSCCTAQVKRIRLRMSPVWSATRASPRFC
jgi:hypothetical protein